MTDPSSRPSVQSLVDHPVAKSVGSTIPLIRAGVLAVSVAAAIPTAHNLYYSFAHGIPYQEVPHRLAQYDLWMKNLDCKIEYRQLLTGAGTKVDVGACPTSQDIAIKISSTTGHSTYEWIAFNQLQKPTATSLLNLVVQSALAEEAAPHPRLPSSVPSTMSNAAPPSLRVAENGLQVMCQRRDGNHVVRIIQEAGKCYREVVSLFRGSIDRRVEVPCETTCK